jgi:accessory colonization factor AcfC
MKLLTFISLFFCLQKLQAQSDTLFVYGPGGPQVPMEECARLFSTKMAVTIKVIAGPEDKWIEQASQDADIIYGGAEYMLTQFAAKHKGFLDGNTTTELYKREAGILVRKGNPKKIKNLEDLTAPGIKLLNIDGAGQLGMWEDIAGRQDLIAEIQKNIGASFANTALGIEAWRKEESYDAWITFTSWNNRLKDVSELVPIPPSKTIYRGTPIAVTTITNQKRLSLQFIHYLKSKEAHQVFVKWGWK